jgi:hypothetical protein
MVDVVARLRDGQRRNRGWIPRKDRRYFFSPKCPGRLWGPPNLLFIVYRRKSGRGVKLTSHLHVVPRLKLSGAIPPVPHMPECFAQGQPYPYFLHLSVGTRHRVDQSSILSLRYNVPVVWETFCSWRAHRMRFPCSVSFPRKNESRPCFHNAVMWKKSKTMGSAQNIRQISCIIPSIESMSAWVCNSRPARIYYAVRGHICKLCIHCTIKITQ